MRFFFFLILLEFTSVFLPIGYLWKGNWEFLCIYFRKKEKKEEVFYQTSRKCLKCSRMKLSAFCLLLQVYMMERSWGIGEEKAVDLPLVLQNSVHICKILDLTSLLLLLGKVQCKGRSLKKWNLFKSVRVSRVVWNAAEVNWKCVTLLICHRLIIHVLVTFNNFQMRMGSMRERGGIH